ncbi:Os11g0644650, partial [Oryza sativa Japonica Group]
QVRADGPPQHVPSRHPELPRAPHHRQLPHRRAGVVAPDDGHRAAGERAGAENDVHGDHQVHAPRRRHDVLPLGAPQHRRRRRGSLRQHVVHHHRVPEHAARAPHHLHRRRAQHVVHVEVEVRRRRVRHRRPRGERRGEDDDAERDEHLGRHFNRD